MSASFPFFRMIQWLVLALVLVSCSSERHSDQQWAHSELGSYAAAFSPDGRYVLVGDVDLPAKLWDIEANKIVHTWQNMPDQNGTTTAVGFSGDGKIAATCETDVVVLWDMATGEPTMRFTFPAKVKAMALSPAGDHLLVALTNRKAVYFDVIANRVVQIFEHDGSPVNSPINQLINAVAISPSGKYAMTGGDDQTARLWSLETGKQIHSWKHGNSVDLVSFYPGGGFVVSAAGNDHTHFWNMKTGERIHTLRMSPWPKDMALPDFPVFNTTTSALAYSPDGKYLVTGHPSQMLCVWSLSTGDKLDCWQVARKQALRPGVVIQAVSFSADGNAIYSESGNGIGQKWKLR